MKLVFTFECFCFLYINIILISISQICLFSTVVTKKRTKHDSLQLKVQSLGQGQTNYFNLKSFLLFCTSLIFTTTINTQSQSTHYFTQSLFLSGILSMPRKDHHNYFYILPFFIISLMSQAHQQTRQWVCKFALTPNPSLSSYWSTFHMHCVKGEI